MPIYKARLRMKDSALINDNDYTFNFHVYNPGSSDDAWGSALEIAEAYQGTLNPPNVTIYEVSIFNKDVVNGVQNRPQSLVGARIVTGDALPGWNTSRMQASVDVGLRVHTWYLRMGLTENDVTGQTLTSTTQTAVNDFITALQIPGVFCDKDGGVFDNFLHDEYVHMRQLGWHRRVRPGFKRGWVPA